MSGDPGFGRVGFALILGDLSATAFSNLDVPRDLNIRAFQLGKPFHTQLLGSYSTPTGDFVGSFEGQMTSLNGVAPIPEPSTVLLLGSGLTAAFLRRRRQGGASV
jgi:hypothetical protein